MPQAANIVIADALATPVNHTFVPVGPDPKVANSFWWEDQSQLTAAGYWRIRMTLTRPPMASAGQSTDGRVYRVKIELHEPVLEVPVTATYNGIAPAPQVSYVQKFFCEFVLPERSSPQNRKDLRKMAALLIADANVVALTETFQAIY